jgi:hypothetical protein
VVLISSEGGVGTKRQRSLGDAKKEIIFGWLTVYNSGCNAVKERNTDGVARMGFPSQD